MAINEPLLYLASASPRRRELLAQIGVPFARLAVDVPEVPMPNEAPEVYCLRVALAKARAGRALLAADDRLPVLGADTTVAVDEQPLGKPRDRAEAAAMLERLSGRTHEVYTAVALVSADGREASRLAVSHVTMRQTGADERACYAATGEPDDKAGGYAIQGLAAVFIERLEGSYSGVMGLPLFETAELLAMVGIDPVKSGGARR